MPQSDPPNTVFDLLGLCNPVITDYVVILPTTVHGGFAGTLTVSDIAHAEAANRTVTVTVTRLTPIRPPFL